MTNVCLTLKSVG